MESHAKRKFRWGRPALKPGQWPRFSRMHKVIREALLVDHLDCTYIFTKQEERDGRMQTFARTTVMSIGKKLKITYFPCFFTDYDLEEQVHAMIHEHVHVALHDYHQVIDQLLYNHVPRAGHPIASFEERQGAEVAVDHLTEVFFRLLEPKLCRL